MLRIEGEVGQPFGFVGREAQEGELLLLVRRSRPRSRSCAANARDRERTPHPHEGVDELEPSMQLPSTGVLNVVVDARVTLEDDLP